VQRVESSIAGDVWHRLSSLDFMNEALLLAAVMVLWLFPNLIFLSAVTGRSFTEKVARHMGLNSDATHSLERLFPASSTSSGLTVGAIFFLVMAVLATVTVIQKLWATIFGVESPGGWDDIWRQFVWGAVAIGGSTGVSFLTHDLNKVSPALAAVVNFALLFLFFWLGMHLLLAGRVSWRDLVPPALVTTAFFLGFGAFSAFFLSDAVIANNKEYGPIGIVFILMTWLLALGVVLILGPVLGAAWRERHPGRRAERAAAGPG
jgi:membrane protein